MGISPAKEERPEMLKVISDGLTQTVCEKFEKLSDAAFQAE
jgi:hypothetical protein